LIKRQNPLSVALHPRLRVDHSFTDFNFLGQRRIVKLAVTFEIDLVYERVFFQLNDQGIAALEHLNIGKQPRLKQDLYGFVDFFRIELIAP
jgi:hypothetical protein